MKKILVSLVIVIAAVWLILSFAAKSKKTTVAAREWPMELGRLDSVPARYPKQTRTPAAAELERLVKNVGIEFLKRSGQQAPDPIAVYVRKQLQRTDRTIEPAPPIPVELAPVRAHLLSGAPIGWDVDIARGASAPLPNLLAHMRLTRLFTASALERARTGEHAAWDDLRASHTLSRGLWKRPELISALIALAIDRNIIAAARQMPTPAPAWFDEIRNFDYRKAMQAAMQAEAWIISASIREISDSVSAEANPLRRFWDRMVKGPYYELSRADLVAHQRNTAVEISKVRVCALDAQDFERRRLAEVAWWNQPGKFLAPNVMGSWERVFRLRAELELAEHALGLRSGSQSRCSDGHWIVTPASVKFSKAIPLDSPSEIPLEIRR